MKEHPASLKEHSICFVMNVKLKFKIRSIVQIAACVGSGHYLFSNPNQWPRSQMFAGIFFASTGECAMCRIPASRRSRTRWSTWGSAASGPRPWPCWPRAQRRWSGGSCPCPCPRPRPPWTGRAASSCRSWRADTTAASWSARCHCRHTWSLDTARSNIGGKTSFSLVILTKVGSNLGSTAQCVRTFLEMCAPYKIILPPEEWFSCCLHFIRVLICSGQSLPSIHHSWVVTRAANEPSRRLKFYNHRKGPY